MSTVQLHLGDCLEFLATLGPGSVDAVVTDPPFSEKTHVGIRSQIPTGRSGRLGFADGDGTRSFVAFGSIEADGFLAFCRECVRVSRRWVVMTCDWRHAALAEDSGLPVVRCGVWIKPDAAPQFTGDRPGTGWDAVLILHREGKKRWNGGGRHAVWIHGRDRSTAHPSVKPLSLLLEWLALFTDSGETVMDPMMGSGTTAIACIRTGRNFIGCEIDPAYFAVAERRIEAERERVRMPLFDPRPTQATLFGTAEQ